MTAKHPLVPLLEAIEAALGWLENAGIARVIVGGVAASLYGRPRATRDVDIVAIADESRWANLVKSGERFGIWPRRADALDFAKTTRVLLLEHRPTSVEVDVSMAGMEFEIEMVASAQRLTLSGVEIPVARPDDILIMKCLALRPRDVADIEGILQVQEGLDLKRVRETLAQFSEILEKVDYVAEWDALVKRSNSKRE